MKRKTTVKLTANEIRQRSKKWEQFITNVDRCKYEIQVLKNKWGANKLAQNKWS